MTQPLLVVFDNRNQLEDFKRIFPMVVGMFRIYRDGLTGHRFERVVAFRPIKYESELEYEDKVRELKEHLPTRVMAGGEFCIL